MKETKPRNRLSYMLFVSFVACGGFSVSMFRFKETWKHFKIIHSCMDCFTSIAHKKDALKCKFHITIINKMYELHLYLGIND